MNSAVTRRLRMTKLRNFFFSSALLVSSPSALWAIQPVYTEVSAASGIAFQSESNPMTAGIAWIDYDNDGNQDLFIPNTSGPNRLYHNQGNGQFIEVAAQLNVQRPGEASRGAAIGDYDGDGNDDIFIANGGVNTLLRNKGDADSNGVHDGFEDVTVPAMLGIEDKSSFAGTFGDVDGDLDLDLYVSNWNGFFSGACPANDLYLNNGDGSFSKAPVSVGADDVGCSFVSSFSDFDIDGDLDIFVVNDNLDWLSGNPALDNDMLRNDGLDTNGLPVLVSAGDVVGLGEGLTGMGLAIGDIDNDGDLDYYRTEIDGRSVLSVNDGSNMFSDQRVPMGVNGGPGCVDTGCSVGWGAAFFDANNDGFLDLYRGNSGAGFGGDAQENWFYLNNQGNSFTEMSTAVGLLSINAGLGLAYADYDNDGDMDVVLHGQYGDVTLFRNDTPSVDNWLLVRLQGKLPNHRGIGAKVRLTSSNGSDTRQQMREIHAGSSHGSTHAAPVHFGLGDHDVITDLSVEWPGGCVQHVAVSTVNQETTVAQSQCVKGVVRDNAGNPVQGVILFIADNFGFSTSMTTDVNGRYSQEVPPGLYVVSHAPSSPYLVTPVEGNIFTSVGNSDVTKDFIATPVLPSISGTVRDASGNPVQGAILFIADNADFSTSVTTDANGRYSQDVPANTLYVVSHTTSSPYLVTPVEGNIFTSVGTSDVTKDFVATPAPPTISGTVRDASGNPVQGAILFIADNADFSTSVTTDANGQYSRGVPANTLYVVSHTPSSPYLVTPVEGNIFTSVGSSDVTKDFTATPR